MLDVLTDVLSRAPARCDLAEARHVATDEQELLVRNGRVDGIDGVSADGVGVRVRAGGGWGFAATREATLDACADAAAGRAELDATPPRPDRDELRALYAGAF